MTINMHDPLVILAGGQSRRMGRDKALAEIKGKRMIDHMIDRYRDCDLSIILSARQDYETGLEFVADEPSKPDGPVGAIFTLCDYFLQQDPPVRGFYTVPVDAPNAPLDLIDRLESKKSCTVASSKNRLHPVFAYWRCDIVRSVNYPGDPGTRAPSLQWLTQQCHSKTVTWTDETVFANINTPEELSTIIVK